jgi:hypothetical protein
VSKSTFNKPEREPTRAALLKVAEEIAENWRAQHGPAAQQARVEAEAKLKAFRKCSIKHGMKKRRTKLIVFHLDEDARIIGAGS